MSPLLPRGAALRRSIYAGEIHRAPAGDASRALAGRVRAILDATPPPSSEATGAGARIHAHANEARRRVLVDAAVSDGVRAVLAALGLAPDEHAYDPPRLRAIQSGAHAIPEAAAAYYAHRDTWYANPRAQVNVWIPLHDVAAEETFTLFPSAFGRAVENDSATFDYATWVETVGWQRPGGAARGVYPRALRSLDGQERYEFAAEAGTVLLFSAAHLHQTRAHASGRTRYSVDFRVVHLADHEAGLGAPDVDNRSTGAALVDYVTPGAK